MMKFISKIYILKREIINIFFEKKFKLKTVLMIEGVYLGENWISTHL